MNTIVVQLRTQRAAIRQKRAVVAAQARGREDVRTAAVEAIEGLAADGRSRADRALARIAAGDSPRGAVLGFFGSGADRPIDPAALVALLGADTVAAVMLARLDSVPPGLTAAERASQLAELDAELNQLEHAEEQAIADSERAGNLIPRRDDCRIDVVLALAAPARPARKPRAAMPADVAADVDASVTEDAMRKARHGLRPDPARGEYLARGRNRESA